MPPSMAGPSSIPSSWTRFIRDTNESGSAAIAPDPFDVGQIDELLRPEGARQGARRGVGIEVVDLAVLSCAERGNDRNEAVLDEVGDESHIDRRHLADVSESRVLRNRGEQPSVDSGQPDGRTAMTVQEVDDVGIDLTRQDPLDHPYGGVVGDPQTVDKLRNHALLFHRGRDLGPAAVDDDRTQAHHGQKGHVAGEALMQAPFLHRGSAVLDDDGPAPERLDVGQSLHQDSGLAHGIGDPALGQVGRAVAGGHDRSPLNRTYSGVRSVVTISARPPPPPTEISITKSPVSNLASF